jgi:hypothetical protein
VTQVHRPGAIFIGACCRVARGPLGADEPQLFAALAAADVDSNTATAQRVIRILAEQPSYAFLAGLSIDVIPLG